MSSLTKIRGIMEIDLCPGSGSKYIRLWDNETMYHTDLDKKEFTQLIEELIALKNKMKD